MGANSQKCANRQIKVRIDSGEKDEAICKTHPQ